MKILIVHDRDSVSREISELIGSIGLPKCDVTVVCDGASAAQELRQSLYDLAIIDLTIPYIAGQTSPDVATAENLLRELFQLGTFNPPGDVIGLSREPETVERLSASVGPHLMAMIEEDAEGRVLDRAGWGGLWAAVGLKGCSLPGRKRGGRGILRWASVGWLCAPSVSALRAEPPPPSSSGRGRSGCAAGPSGGGFVP